MNDSKQAIRRWLAIQAIRDDAACRCRLSDPPEMHDPRCDVATGRQTRD